MILFLFILSFLLGTHEISGKEFFLEESYIIETETCACMPSACKLKDGRVFLAYSTGWEPVPEGSEIYYTIFDPEMNKWEKSKLLVPYKKEWSHSLGNGAAVLDDGSVIVPFAKNHVFPFRGKDPSLYDINHPETLQQVWIAQSFDNATTFSIRKISKDEPCKNFGTVIQLENREILLPAYWHVVSWKNNKRSSYREHGFFKSKDMGKSWDLCPMEKVKGYLPSSLPEWEYAFYEKKLFSEISPLYLKNGSILAVLRSGGKRRLGFSFSYDQGKVWTQPFYGSIKGKMPSLTQMEDGTVLMAVGMEGLMKGWEIFKHPSRKSFASLFVAEENEVTFKKVLEFSRPELQEDSKDIVPCDSPVIIPLGRDRILVIIQGMDRAEKNNPHLGFNEGMYLIINIFKIK